MPQIKIPAVYYRGGTSKGIFFKRTDLPAAAQEAGGARDKILCAYSAAPTLTANRLTVWATPVRPPAKL